MKAYVYDRYGGPEVLHLADVEKPVPKDNEVLIKIHATTITAGDWRALTLEMPKGFGFMGRLFFGITRPRQPILGTELAGVVETVGKDVTRFKPGDAVFAFPGAKMGGHAQYRAVAEDSPIALKPENLSFEDAAALSFGGSTALHFLRNSGIKPGEKMLVIGASGNVGTAMVQLAKHFGAEVTGVTSTGNLELVTALGADHVIDYTRDDFAKSGKTWDIIADTVGVTSFDRCKHTLKPGGRLLIVVGDLSSLFSMGKKADGKRVLAGPAAERREDIQQLADLASAGVLRAVVDRRYTFGQMAEAHAYVATGRKRGSVVVTVDQDG